MYARGGLANGSRRPGTADLTGQAYCRRTGHRLSRAPHCRSASCQFAHDVTLNAVPRTARMRASLRRRFRRRRPPPGEQVDLCPRWLRRGSLPRRWQRSGCRRLDVAAHAIATAARWYPIWSWSVMATIWMTPMRMSRPTRWRTDASDRLTRLAMSAKKTVDRPRRRTAARFTRRAEPGRSETFRSHPSGGDLATLVGYTQYRHESRRMHVTYGLSVVQFGRRRSEPTNRTITHHPSQESSHAGEQRHRGPDCSERADPT